MKIETVQKANELIESLTGLKALVSSDDNDIIVYNDIFLQKNIPLTIETQKRLKSFFENEVELIQKELDNL